MAPEEVTEIPPLTDRERTLVAAVRDRINATIENKFRAGGGLRLHELPVSDEEFDACAHAVRINLIERGLPPILITGTGRGILFKNVEIYPNIYS